VVGRLLGPGPGDPLPRRLPAAALLIWRGDPDERRGAGIAALVGGTPVALRLLAAALGKDYFDGRNLLPAFVPLLIVIGAGFGVRRAGRAAAVAFCLCVLVFTLQIDRLPRLQREDLRNAAARVGPLGPAKIVITDRYIASQPLHSGATPSTPPVREIDLVGAAAAGRHAAHLLPGAFRLVGAEPVPYDFTLTRFRASHPVRVPLRLLENGALVGGGGRATVLLATRPSRPRGGPVPGR
jgi:hypothetical protein